MATLAGTLKIEIIKPESDTWERVGGRLRAMRRTVGPALNMAMRDLYVDAVDMISAIQSKSEDATARRFAFEGKVEKILRTHWNEAMARQQAFNAKNKRPDPEESFALVTEYWSAETRHNIASRFSGEHLKDILASRASFPSWHQSSAFYARSSKSAVEGPPSAAVLTLPLWGAGKKATRVVVAPCGANGEIMWRKLVAGEVKLGRVGVSYDENRRKWYALVSWSKLECPDPTGRKIAAAHVGVTRFVQVVCADGSQHNVSGEDILVTRKRFQHRRASIQRCINDMGTGSKGRGVKRRMRPVTKLEDAEGRFVTTRIRQIAHGVISWCLAHDVGTLLWPDMTGLREGFEKKTGGEAHEEVRRLIHQFPYYELEQAVKRDGKERGVEVRLHSVRYDSQTCPKCGEASDENLRDVTQLVEVIEHHGRRFERKEVIKRFACGCGFKGHRDVVACVNALQRSGEKDVWKKVRVNTGAAVVASVSEVMG